MSTKKKIAMARRTAFRVLEEVERGGYASELLREAARDLSARDAALAGQLVLGSLRVQNQLDFLIERYSGHPADSLDFAVRMALRLGIYQVRYLDRIPMHAAVDESVEFVKQHKRAASGLTNAVLRKVNRTPTVWPSEALAHGCPEWMMARWREHFGAVAAKGIAEAALQEPEPYIRIPAGDSPPDGIELEATLVPGCYKLLSPIQVSPNQEGVRLHDISSQAIVPLLQLETQHSYLDLCAAPGNKTAQALEAHPKLAVACDISEPRLEMVRANVLRVVLDAAEELPFRRKFDRIFIDAPCSGTGTLGRNPEIKWRLTRDELIRQQARQINILKRAVDVLETGGRIVYATCSLEQEENEDVVRAVTHEKAVRCEREVWRIPGRDAGDGFYSAVLAGA